MRLLYITDALAIFGGLERVLTQKVNWLADHGYDVCVLTANQGNHPFCFSLHPKVRFEDLGIFFYKQYSSPIWKRLYVRHELNRKFRQSVRDKIRVFTPDIIICTKLEYVRNIIRVKGDIPFIFESHSSCLCELYEGDGFPRRLVMWFAKLSIKKANAIVALTNGDAIEWRKYTSKVYVITNVVHLNDTGTYGSSSSKSAIFVGRFSIQKDIDSLLRIWSTVHKCHPDWWLHVYGDYCDFNMNNGFPYKDKNIVIHTPSSNIFEEYIKCSMLLLTSRYEPFGLVLPEAMSCGLPVVAFDCPYGPADIITDGVDGFLIRNRNIDDYVNKVCSLIENEKIRCEMGRAGVISSQRYRASAIMPEWIKLFKQLCKK